MRLVPLRVTARLASAVVASQDVHLDALLAYVAHKRTGGSIDIDRRTPIRDIKQYALPLARVTVGSSWVWACSAWDLPRGAQPHGHHLTRRRDSVDVDEAARAFVRGYGPGRDLLKRREAVLASSTSWLCVGNPREVRKALELCDSLGGLRGHGAGEVTAWEVEEVDSPGSWSIVDANGCAARHLPVSWCERAGEVQRLACRPPYWHPGMQGPAVRAGVPVTLTREALAAALELDR